MDLSLIHIYAAGVNIGLMGQVHEVVDHQPVVAIYVIEAAAIGPIGAFGPRQMVKGFGLGEGRVARPHPDEAVALDDGERLDGVEAGHVLAGHAHGAAFAACLLYTSRCV